MYLPFFSLKLVSMPNETFIGDTKSLLLLVRGTAWFGKWVIVKRLLLFTFLLSLVILLSGCSAIGSNKPAALQITTTPEASVFLDGKHLGKTPFYSDQLKPGVVGLKLTASEATFVSEITLRSSTLTYVNRQLATNYLAQGGEVLHLVKGRTGVLFTTEPGGAEIIIDGKLLGKAPQLFEGLSLGEHQVEVNASGYLPSKFAIKVVKGYQLQGQITLASEIAKNVVTLAKKPEVIKVEITSTPQGFLRVRKEALATSSEVGRVKPKEKYEVIQETKDWVKISFQGKQGWVSSQYTKKI